MGKVKIEITRDAGYFASYRIDYCGSSYERDDLGALSRGLTETITSDGYGVFNDYDDAKERRFTRAGGLCATALILPCSFDMGAQVMASALRENVLRVRRAFEQKYPAVSDVCEFDI